MMLGLTSSQLFVLIIVWLGVYCNYVSYSVIAPFFPQLAKQKGLSAEHYSIVFAVYSIAQILLSFIVGRYLSRIGAKPVLVGGLLMTGISTIGFGCIASAPSGSTFFALSVSIRFIEGAGFAAYFTSALAVIVDTFPTDPGYFVGLTELIVTLGMVMGPPMGSILYTLGGYPTPFVTFGVAMLLVSISANFLIRDIEPRYENIDLNRPKQKFTISAREYLDVLKLPAAILTIACVTLNVIADIFVLITMSSHLQQFKLSAIQIGFIYLCLFLSYGISSPLAGKIADRLHCEFLLQSLGSLIIIIALVLIGPIPVLNNSDASLSRIIVGLLLKGFGAGPLIACSFSSCLHAAKLYAHRDDDFRTYTLVSTIISFSIPLGNLIGGFWAGILYEHLGMAKSCTLFASLFLGLAVTCLIQYIIDAKKRQHKSQHQKARYGNGHIISSELEPLCVCANQVGDELRQFKK